MLRMSRSIITRRSIHTIPKLNNITQLQTVGIPQILSAKGFNIIWTQTQDYLCKKLTMNTMGTEMESNYPFHIVLKTSKDPMMSHVFNYASGVHNNHLFIENILPSATGKDNVPSKMFLNRVKEYFDGKTWEELKELMIQEAMTRCLGQGWLFLVERANKRLDLMVLQNNGTPYYFGKNQQLDLNSAINLDEFNQLHDMKRRLKKGKGSPVVEGQEHDNNKDWTVPIICVNLWDHAYLNDYGFLGKKDYIKNVLDNLNWAVINNRLYS
ncbi:mitochondrial 37S ribosomal protein mS42 NDAI_0D00440 [Naumovozyma dairenensis CBS 421]|uniref:Manganese/iron superoxide dismutase C-terminal domain-containing protein n=1 Tax=Naumovozyma dairenensis (strain ATCC 10597 / BCRC 20456 / CBS 421 / NBRC 0211 / NRRL Y-12639) TaxID=1071378 RepID=G0W997_NAUDC|nr:hypothetical protein NDAI_0D00440 [Naumovozyma dairenensis CBS 421]CCD24358.1 hypothetical protein NDAI_0D00440 [Naumovozyma dairenensis CBS 421]